MKLKRYAARTPSCACISVRGLDIEGTRSSQRAECAQFAWRTSSCGARFGRNRWLAEDALARINAQIEERAKHAQATGHQKRRLPVDELNHITNCDGR